MYNIKPLPVVISQRAKDTPDSVAIESIATGGTQVTWHELDSNCRRWADALRRLNVERGEYVVTMMPNTPDATYAWIGCGWLQRRRGAGQHRISRGMADPCHQHRTGPSSPCLPSVHLVAGPRCRHPDARQNCRHL